MSDTLPSRTYECCACEETYFAGKHSGPGPFFCAICGAELTLRPVGAEPYESVPLEVRRRVCGQCPAVVQLNAAQLEMEQRGDEYQRSFLA